MCRASLIPKQEDRQAEERREREERWDRLDREAIETANRYRTGERPVNISWSVDRNPDPVRRHFDEEGNLRRQEESIRDGEEDEVGF
jgi:hypothetical protein